MPLRIRPDATSKDCTAGTGKYDPPKPARFRFAATFFVPDVYTSRHLPLSSSPLTLRSPFLAFSMAEMDS